MMSKNLELKTKGDINTLITRGGPPLITAQTEIALITFPVSVHIDLVHKWQQISLPSLVSTFCRYL